MLNPFPGLLIYAFYAPMLLRIVAALAFAGAGYALYARRHELAHLRFPIIGRAGWWAWLAAVAHIAIAVGLFFGYYTQWAALLGLLVTLKGALLAKRYARAFPLCRLEYVLLAAICASLLLSGAGAYAFDLPL